MTMWPWQPPSQGTGQITLADIDRLIDSLRSFAAPDDVLVLSPYLAENWEEINRRAAIDMRKRAQRYRAERKRIKRERRLVRRRRRAAQRKHHRGER